jgi:uncharacterized membrane protein YpjA
MKRYRLLILMVLLINLLGTFFGFLYYGYMFEIFPKTLWIFIPDSPGSTLLFAAALYFILIGKKKDVLSFLASVSVMKYGFWTMFTILFYSDYFLSPSNLVFYYLMFFLHFGMFVEPVLVVHKIDFKKRYLIISAFWFLLNDYFDYVVGVNPITTYGFSDMGTVAVVSVISTVVLIAFMYYLTTHKSLFERLFLWLERV